MDYAKRGRPDDHPDEAIFAEFKKAMDTVRGRDDRATSYAAKTIQKSVSELRKLGDWLQTRNLSLTQLIDDPDELDVQVTSYLESGVSTRVKRALEVLRTYRAGRNVVRQRNVVRHRDCEALITQFKEKLEEAGGKDQAPGHAPRTIRQWVSELHKLDDWLQTRNLSLAQLIDDADGSKLDEQVTWYLGSDGGPRVKRALEVLRSSRAGMNLSHFPRVPYPEDGQLIDGHLNHVGGAAP
ncbi:hypothetical protein, partial [Rhizobium johnstonii]